MTERRAGRADREPFRFRMAAIPLLHPYGAMIDHVSIPVSDLSASTASKDAVMAFHETALARGGRDDGAPGPRQAAMTSYFGAFIRDPDGNKIEAVTFPRETGAKAPA